MAHQSVFISYSREDQESARQVEETLHALGVKTWRDELSADDDAWPRTIGKAISSHDLMLLLWSRHAADSSLVEFEWNTGIALQKPIVPCLLDQTPLETSLESFSGIQLAELKQSLPPLLALSDAVESSGNSGRVLEHLNTIPPGDRESMARAGTEILHSVAAASGVSNPDAATMVSPSSPDAATIMSPPTASDPNAATIASVPPTGSSAPPAGSGEMFKKGDLVSNRYQILGLLGVGGMGAVYHARDTELDRDVALKVIKSEIANHPEILERFKREIQLSTKVTHQHVLRVYDLGESRGLKYLTMQYVEGENLSDLMVRGKIPLARTLEIFRQICEGMKAAHDQGVIHRDLKPDNIMLDSNGQVLLTDFGLAKSLQQTAMTQAGQVMGTPDYMSPEQVKGEEVSKRSDIYSLGAMLYEMASGQVPFSGNTVFEVMIQRTQKEPDSISSINPDVPPFLEHIISRSMAREQEARYADLDELLADLSTGVETGRTGSSGVFYARRLSVLARAVTWKRIAIALPIIFILSAGLFSVLQDLGFTEGRAPAVAPAPVEPMSVLIADFVNMTGESVFDGTLEQSLSIGLEGASFLESFRRERARAIATELKPDLQRLDRDAARLVAQREGISAVVTGSVESAGGSYTVSAEAIDPFSGDSISRGQARANSREEVLAAVGQVAMDIRRALGDRASEAEMRASVETFTTSSLEAAQAYASAQTLQQQGKWHEAIIRYTAAVDLDANMGRAYSGLAVMNFNLGNQEEADKYFLMAMSQLDRMTPRERYRTQGNYYILNRDYEKAVEAYTALVEQVPGDSLGRANLAYAAFFARDFQGAFERGKQIADANPSNVVMRANSAWYAMFSGDFEVAESEARKSLDLDDSFRQTYSYLALTELAQGKVDDARQTLGRLQQQGPLGASMAASGLADLAFFQGKFRETIRILNADLATAEPSTPGLKRTSKALAHLELGQTGAAVRSADEALALTQKLGVVFEAGLVHLRAGNSSRAMELAAQLTESLQLEDQAYGRLLEGEAARMDGNVQEAIRIFRESQNLADTVLGRLFLGRAYLDGEAFPSAYSEFEQCLNRRGEFTSIFLDEAPTYCYFPPVHFYMAKAQEGLGSPAAGSSFNAFLTIRGEGDPDPRVDEARGKVPSQ